MMMKKLFGDLWVLKSIYLALLENVKSSFPLTWMFCSLFMHLYYICLALF